MSFTDVAIAAPSSLSYQGRILKVDGTPLSYNNVSFIFQIKGGPNDQCLIYQEQVNGVDLSSSGGVFDVPIGTGTVYYPTAGSFTVLDSFNNSGSLVCGSCVTSGSSVSCSPSGSSFTPSGDETRTLVVQFFDGSGWQRITPSTTIRSVPFAGYALSAQKLGTNLPSDFILKSSINNSGSGSASCSGGNFLTWDATTMKFGCAGVTGSSGGTVQSVTASAGSSPYLTVSADTVNPVISLNVGTTAGKLAAADDSRLVHAVQDSSTAGGDVSGTFANLTVAKINGVPLQFSSPADGQYLKYSAGKWVNSALTISDLSGLSTQLSSKLDVAQMPSTCGAGQTLTYVSPSNMWTCLNISISESNITGTISAAKISGNISGDAAGFTGNLTGDVTGPQGATKVVALQNTAVSSVAPASNQILMFNGSAWAPASLPGGYLSLSGGTMTGAIDMGSQDLSSVGNVFQVNDKMLKLSNNAANPTLSGAGDKGKMWFDSVVNQIKYYDGAAIRTVANNSQFPTCSANQYLTYDGTSFTCANDAGASGAVANLTSGTSALTFSSSTGSITATIATAGNGVTGLLSGTDWTTFNSKIDGSSLNASNLSSGIIPVARFPALTGDVSSTAGGVTTSVDKIKGKSVVPVVYSAGQVLRYDGTNWVNNNLSMFDLRSTVTGVATFGGSSIGCTSNQTLTWTAATDNLSCTNISLPVGQVTGTLPIANGGTGATTQAGAANAVLPAQASNSGKFLTTDGTNVSWAASAASQWTTTGSDIYYNTGKVGVGTTAPSSVLDVVSSLGSSSGTDYGMKLLPTLNGSGTEGYTGLFVNVTQNTVGSGSKLLMDLQLGGASKFKVSDTGNITSTGVLTIPSVTGSNSIISQNQMSVQAFNSNSYTTSSSSRAIPLGVKVDVQNMSSSDTNLSLIDFVPKNTSGNTQGAYIGAVSISGAGSYTPNIVLGMQTGATAYSEMLRIDSAGNVGIGTATPAGKLTVQDSGATGIQIKASGAAAVDTMNLINDMDANGEFWFAKGTTANASPAVADKLVNITNQGNVEIYGQSVTGANDNSGILSLKTEASSVGGTRNEVSMEFYADRTDLNNRTGFIGFESNTALDLTLQNDENGNMIFATFGTERMRINSAGSVGIGTTSPGYKLDVQGGDINASGSVRAAGVALTSDMRFKRDIQTLDHSLEKILRVRGVSYHWRRDEFPERKFSARHQIGVIAQEIEKEFPEAVDTNPDGYKAVNYPALVSPLIESTKELYGLCKASEGQFKKMDRQLASLDGRVQKLESENAALRKDNESLRKDLELIKQKLGMK